MDGIRVAGGSADSIPAGDRQPVVDHPVDVRPAVCCQEVGCPVDARRADAVPEDENPVGVPRAVSIPAGADLPEVWFPDVLQWVAPVAVWCRFRGETGGLPAPKAGSQARKDA